MRDPHAFSLEDGRSLAVDLPTSEHAGLTLPLDLSKAWREADQAGLSARNPHERAQALIAQCRCALLTASLNSLASGFPPELLVALVRQQLWPLDRAIEYVRSFQRERDRARALAMLAQEASSTRKRNKLHQEVVKLVLELDVDPELRDPSRGTICFFIELLPYLPDLFKQRLLESGLQLIPAIEDEYERMDACQQIASVLPMSMLPRLLEIVKGLSDPFHQQLAAETLAA